MMSADAQEWEGLRQERDGWQRDAERLKLQNKEAEYYAATLESALERIRVAARLINDDDVKDLVIHLTRFKDTRPTIR